MVSEVATGQLSSVLDGLAARLVGSSIKRSEIEAVLEDVGGDADLWLRVDAALREAQIDVIYDVVASAPPARADDRVAEYADRDPIDAGRDRIYWDKFRRPDRLAKVILTAEEEVGLTLLARPGGVPLGAGGFASLSGEARLAAETMLLHNMGLIHSVAQRRVGQGLEYDDLVAHGIPGLVRAIELFDPTLGHKFSTYAMHWIRQSIGRAIDNEGRIIRLPVHICESIRQVKAAQERLVVDGKMPSWETLSRECQIPIEKVKEFLQLAPAVVSLDKPVGNDGVTIGDLLDRPVHEANVEVYGLTADDLTGLLDDLTVREGDVLRRRHGLLPYDEEHTLDEIGVVYGVTRERIRQIEKNAMTQIRIRLGLEEKERRRKAESMPAQADTARRSRVI